MRQLNLMEDGSVGWSEVPEPELTGPGEILPWEEAPEKFGVGETKRIFVRD